MKWYEYLIIAVIVLVCSYIGTRFYYETSQQVNDKIDTVYIKELTRFIHDTTIIEEHEKRNYTTYQNNYIAVDTFRIEWLDSNIITNARFLEAIGDSIFRGRKVCDSIFGAKVKDNR